MSTTTSAQHLRATERKQALAATENAIFKDIRNILLGSGKVLTSGEQSIHILPDICPTVRDPYSGDKFEIVHLQLDNKHILYGSDATGSTFIIQRGTFSTNDMAEILEALEKTIEPIERTAVVFYIENKSVLALFPNNFEGDDKYACYSHVGQHSSVHADYIKKLKKAKYSEYRALATELRGRGYTLHIDQ